MPAFDLPLISIVMPLHNQAAYLTEAVESIAAQSYANKELIIVENGSQDASQDLMYQLCERYPWVRGVTREEANLPHARNTGVELAQGEYIAFLDADDRYLPQALHYLQTELAKARYLQSRTLLCYGFFHVIDHSGKLREQVQVPAPYSPVLRQLSLVRMILPSASMVHRSIFAGGLRFNPQEPIGCDLDFHLKLARQDVQFVSVPQFVTQYRRHAEQMTQDLGAMRFATDRLLSQHLVEAGLDRLFPAANSPEALAQAIDQHVRKGMETKDSPYGFWSFMLEVAQFLAPTEARASILNDLQGGLIALWLEQRYRQGEAFVVDVDPEAYATALKQRLHDKI